MLWLEGLQQPRDAFGDLLAIARGAVAEHAQRTAVQLLEVQRVLVADAHLLLARDGL